MTARDAGNMADVAGVEEDAEARRPERIASGNFSALAVLGLDLRALPSHPSPTMIDNFVFAQADRLRRLLSPGEQLEMRHVPGIGTLTLLFRGSSPAAAEALCKRTLAAYLPQAPRLPVQGESAASIVQPCSAVGE